MPDEVFGEIKIQGRYFECRGFTLKIGSSNTNFQGKSMLSRHDYIQQIQTLFDIFPVVAILGPKQCGKTTLTRDYSQQQNQTRESYFDQEEDKRIGFEG